MRLLNSRDVLDRLASDPSAEEGQKCVYRKAPGRDAPVVLRVPKCGPVVLADGLVPAVRELHKYRRSVAAAHYAGDLDHGLPILGDLRKPASGPVL